MNIRLKVEVSIVNHVIKLLLGSCNANMDEIYILKANGMKVHVVVACY